MALIDNLVAYWDLDEASGSAIDIHGTNDLTEINTPASTATAKLGNARHFERDDADAFVTTTVPVTSLPMSISLWIRPEVTNISQNVIGGGINGSNNYAWGIYVTATAKVSFYANDGSASFTEILSTTSLSAATWYHVVVVWRTSTDYELYINNASENTGSTARSPDVSNDRMRLGAYGGSAGGDSFDGEIDEVGIWNKSLSTTEISQLYNSGNALAYASFGGGGGGAAIPRVYHHRQRN